MFHNEMKTVEPGQVGGNWSDKYRSGNPISQRLVSGFEDALLDLTRRTGVRDVHEVGCGEGHLTRLLRREGLDVRGSDVSPNVIKEARERTRGGGQEVDFRVADLYSLEPERDAAKLIVCCEVLEHLDDPGTALEVLMRLARPWLILSVPREPLWRVLNVLRGSYLRRWGNTPGHVQHWSKTGFVTFVSERTRLVEVRSPLPWTMVLAKADRPRGSLGL